MPRPAGRPKGRRSGPTRRPTRPSRAPARSAAPRRARSPLTPPPALPAPYPSPAGEAAVWRQTLADLRVAARQRCEDLHDAPSRASGQYHDVTDCPDERVQLLLRKAAGG